MKTIEDKFGKELEIQVRQEMVLPTQKLASPHVPEPQPWPITGMSANPGYVTPTSILQIKKEKFDHYDYGEHQHLLDVVKRGKAQNMSHHLHQKCLQPSKISRQPSPHLNPEGSLHMYSCFHCLGSLIHSQQKKILWK